MENSVLNPQYILAGLFIVYLVADLKPPNAIAHLIDSNIGKIIIVLSAMALFAYTNPLLGVLGLLVAYQLIRGAAVQTGNAGLEEYAPTEEKKWSIYSPPPKFPYTLEQEIVKNMTTEKFNTEYVKAPYRPTLDDTHDAARL
jgi:hypothetical protein